MSKYPKPAYDFWDRENSFDDLQVICLWAEFEPSQEASQSPKAQVVKRRLENMRSHDLFLPVEEKRVGINGKLDYQLRYWRNDLIAYADWLCEKPAFLFPETRNVQSSPVLDNNGLDSPNLDTSTANTKTGNVPIVTAVPTNEETESGLTRREMQIRFIENLANTLGYPRHAIPIGKKKELMHKCIRERPDLFGDKEHSFIGAWRKASATNRIIIEGREKFKKLR